MHRATLCWAIVVGVLIASSWASTGRADVVSPPPEQCLDGTTPSTGHCGPHCQPTECTGNADCQTGTCRELSLCTTTIVCAGLVAPGEDLSRYERLKATASCESAPCAEGECTPLKVCATGNDEPGGGGAAPAPGTPSVGPTGQAGPGAPPGSGKNPVEEDDGGCSVSPPRAPLPGAPFATLLVTFGLFARRARRVACSLFTLLALSLLPARPAFADAIAANPPCPPNQLYHPGGHQGLLCGAQVCNFDEDCAPSEACMKYCGVPAGVFGITAPSTGRCTADEECGEYPCRPMYCEVGQRVARPADTSTSGPAATLPSNDPAGGGNAGSPAATGTPSENTAGKGSHSEARKVPVDDEGGCSVSVGSGFSRASSFALASFALGLGLRRYKRRNNTSSTR
jgi:hypothetical protein